MKISVIYIPTYTRYLMSNIGLIDVTDIPLV
jgi:hypothetical protein